MSVFWCTGAEVWRFVSPCETMWKINALFFFFFPPPYKTCFTSSLCYFLFISVAVGSEISIIYLILRHAVVLFISSFDHHHSQILPAVMQMCGGETCHFFAGVYIYIYIYACYNINYTFEKWYK